MPTVFLHLVAEGMLVSMALNLTCVQSACGLAHFFTDLLTDYAWVCVFKIIPEFRIFRLTFNRKSASKY